MLGPLKRPGEPFSLSSKRSKPSILPLTSNIEIFNPEATQTLLAMGFSEALIPNALRLAGGDLERAVLYLTGEMTGLEDIGSSQIPGMVNHLEDEILDPDEDDQSLQMPSTSLASVQSHCYQGRSLFYKSGHALDRCIKAACRMCENDIEIIDQALDEFLVNILPETISKHASPPECSRMDADAIDIAYNFYKAVIPLLTIALQRRSATTAICRSICDLLNSEGKYLKATRRRDSSDHLDLLLTTGDVFVDREKLFSIHSCGMSRLQEAIEHFCRCGGFSILDEMIKKLPIASGESVEAMCAFLQVANVIVPYLLTPKYEDQSADWMDRVLDLVDSLQEKQIRSSYARTCVLEMIDELNKLTYHMPSTEHRGENGRIDIARLDFLLKCLKCSQLEARMFALNDLCHVASNAKSTNPIIGEELFNGWLKENKILHLVLNGNLDMAAYADKTNKILAYMAPIMSNSDLAYIWSLRKGRLGVSAERFQSLVSHITSQFSIKQMEILCTFFRKAFDSGENRTFEKVFNICSDIAKSSEDDDAIKMILYEMWDYIMIAKSRFFDVSNALDIHSEIISFKKNPEYRDDFVKRSLDILVSSKVDNDKNVLPILFVVYIRNVLSLGPRESLYSQTNMVTRKAAVLRGENNAWGDLSADLKRKAELKKLLVEQNLYHIVIRNIMKCQRIAHSKSLELQDCVIPGENSRSCFEQEDLLEPVLMDVSNGYTYSQVLQFSLKLITWMLENDVIAFTLERINPLWKCLVEREHSSESEKTEFFHWITRIRKDVICDDILLELLSMFTKLNYDNFTLDGARAFLEIYHRLFVSANEPRKEELRHHWNSLWLILENAQDVTVVDQITCKIVKEGVYGDKISAAPAPFVEFCFNRLNELRQSYEAASSASSCPDVEVSQTYLRKVHRILSVLARYTSAHEETFTFARARNLHGSVNPGRPLRIDMYCDTLRMDKRLLSISTHTNELLANFKERIDSRLSLYNVDTYTMHVNWSEEDKEISMRHPWKTLEQIGIVPSNDDVFYANYGVLRVRLFIKNINSLRSPPHRITFDTSKEKEDELPSALILKKSGIFTVLYNLPSTCDKKVTAVCRMLLSSLPNDIAIEKAFTLQENPVFQSSEQEKRPKCYTILRSYEFQHLDQIREILSLDNPQKCLYGLEVLSGILMPTRSSLSAVDKSRNTITALLKSDILDYIVSNIQKVSLILDQNRLTEDSVYADIVDRTNVILRYVLLNKSFVQDAITEDSNILEMLEPVPSADEVGIKKRKDHLQNMLNIFDSRKHVVKEWTTDRIEIFVDTWISIITSIRVNQNHLLINLTEAGVDRFSEEVDRDVFTIDQALCASKDILASRKKLSFISSKLSVDCLRLQLEVIREWVEHSNTESYYQLLSNFFFIENWQQFVKTVLLDGKDNLLRHVACYYLVSILKLCKMGVSALCMSNIYELLVPVLCNEKTSSQLDSTELAQRQNSLDLTRCISTVLVSTSLSGDDDDVTLWNLVIEAAIELVVPLTEKVLSYELSRSFEAIDGALLSSQMEMIRGLIGSGNLSEQTVLEVGDFIITKLVNGKLFPGYHVNEDNFTDLSSLSPPSRWNDFGVRRQAVYLLLELASTNHGKNAIRLLEKLHMRYENECISGWEFEPDIEEKSYNRVGLKNDGGTCYMNSILQQIFAISTISKQFVSLNVNSSLEWENGLKSSLLLEIQRVFAHLYFLLEKVCVPRGIWNVFCFSGEDQLDTKRQHDAIDFFTELVDRCDTVMEKLKQPLLFKPQLSGKFAYEYICYECYTRHQGPEEEYLTVNLELHGTSLEDCLQHYVDGEILEGENAYHCRECNSKRTTLRRGSFYSLPPTLSIQLKRFTFDFTGRQAQKNNEYCKFPEFLDMNPYMKHAQTFDTKDIDLLFEEIHATQKQGSTTKMSSTPHPSPSSPMKMRRRRRISTLPAQQVNPEDFHYELVGVLAHSGLAAAGHYYSFVKDHESDPRKPKWYELNDSHVKTFDIATEAEQTWFGGHFRAAKGSSLGLPEERTRTWNAYVLFYQKVKKAPTDFSKMSLTSTMHKNAAISDVFLSMPQWLRSEIINKNSRFVKERDLYSDEYRDLMLETAHNFYTSLCHMNIPKEEARSREDMCIQALKFIVSFCYRILWRLSSDFRNSAVLEKAQNVILQLLTYNYNVRKSYLVFLSEDNYKVFDALCCCPSRTVFRSFFESLSFVLVTWSTCDKGSVSEREFTFLRKSITLLKSEFYNNIDNTETILDMLCRIGETELGLKTFWEYEIPSALCELVVVVYDNDHLPRLRVQDKELKADKLKAIPILFLDVLYYGMFHCGQLEEIRLTLSNISVHYLLTWIYCVSSDAPHIGDKIIEILAVADEKLGVQFTTSRINALLHWVTNQVILPGYWESIINLIKHTTLVRQKLGHADCGRALCLFLDEQEVASAEDRSIHSGIIPWLEHMISKGAYNLCADMTRALDNLYSNNSAISEIFNSRAERIKIIGQRIEEFAYDSQVNGVYETSACSRENLHGTFLRDENAPELLDISNIEPIPMQRSKARLDDMDPMEIDCQPASPSSFSATALVTSSSEDLDFKHIM